MHVFLETERLILRRFTEADADDLFALHSDPDVMRFLDRKPTSREAIEREMLPRWLGYYEHGDGFGFWAAVEKSTGAFLGWFHLRPPDERDPDNVELGYRLHTAAWGKGYGTEASRALIRKGFTDLGVRRVFAETMTVNTRSRRVMEKAGLSHVRTYHVEFDDPLPGTEHGEVEYALTREEWERQQAGSASPRNDA